MFSEYFWMTGTSYYIGFHTSVFLLIKLIKLYFSMNNILCNALCKKLSIGILKVTNRILCKL